MAEFTGFCGPTYSSRSRDANAQRCINLFPEVDTHGGNKRYVLYGTPGVEEFAYIGTDPVRGMHVLGSYLYVVAGNKLWAVDQTSVKTELGTLLTSVGPVVMSSNGVAPTGGNQMIISDGEALYLVYYLSDYRFLTPPSAPGGSDITVNIYGAGQSGSSLNLWVNQFDEGLGVSVGIPNYPIAKGTIYSIGGSSYYVDTSNAVTQNRLYVVVTEDAVSDASGYVTVNITPSIDVAAPNRNLSTSPEDNLLLQSLYFGVLYHLKSYTNCVVNGVFVIDTADETGRFRVSDLYSGFIFNDLAIGTAESRPDALRVVYNYRSALVLFGDFTIEVHNYVGSGYPPFVKDSGGTIDHGIAARHSIAEVDNSALWLARNKNGGVYVGRSSGGAPQVVSTPALEHEWGTYLSISDAFAYAYTDRGHSFYVITFPTGDKTFAYDLTTNEWHERSTYQGDPFNCGRHLGSAYAYFNGLHLIGDYRNGQLYKMSMDYYTDNGEPIISMRRAPHIDAERKRVIINRLEVVAETGTVTDSSEPQMRMRISRDGGYTWSSEKWRSMGKQGEYGKRIQWFNQGAAREAVVEIAISDPIKKVILGANIDVEALDA